MRKCYKITIIYLIAGSLWIFFSDLFLEKILPPSEEYSDIQSMKGFVFVGGTGLILFYITRNYENKLLNSIRDLKDSNQRLKFFLYKSSHELRGPIATGLGLIQVMRQMPGEECLSLSYKLEKTALRLDKTLQDLRSIGNLIDHEPKPETVDSEKVIEGTKKELDEGCILQGIEFRRPEKKLRFTSEAFIVKVILKHLIENSVKYRNPYASDSYVSADIEKIKKEIRITVQDNGVGMLPEVKEKVFDMFYRGSTLSEGAGLGLFIVKMGVERLKGNVQLRSEPEKGTTFTVTFPELQKKAG